MSNNDDGDRVQGDYNRPRRPNSDTLSYLRSLPLDIKASNEEVSHFLTSSNEEFPQSLSAALSAIEEIRNEVASLAGDEFGSQCIEILAHTAAPYSEVAARTLLNGMAGYHLHLASHRYGSHVVQTVLQISASSKTKEDLALHEEGPQFNEEEELPSLADLIIGMVDELAPHAAQLAVHVCGSHVLRTLLCVLGGVELMQAPGKGNTENRIMESGAIRRGKAKNKKKKKKPDPTKGVDVPHAGTMHMVFRDNSRLTAADNSFAEALQMLSKSLSGDDENTNNEPGELQQLTCHPSAGPLLIVLLRVLTYSSCTDKQSIQVTNEKTNIADRRLGISHPEPSFDVGSPAHALVKRILCWQETKSPSEQEHASDIIYGLAGETRGSHVLETILRASCDSFYALVLECGAFFTASTLQEYAEDNVSNFVVQTLLCTARTKEQAETLLKSLDRVISSGYVVDPAKKRRGILWRAVELAAKYRVGQDSLLKAIKLGFLAHSGKEDEATDQDAIEEGKKKKKRKKASAVSIEDCVLQLIDLKPPEKEGGRAEIDVSGARTVFHLLRFVPRLCDDTIQGITRKMPQESLELIAKDGLGSRCIMDGILDGPIKEPVFSAAARTLLDKLQGRWLALSVDRVGHHTVKKLFRALPDMDDRAALVEELSRGINRLSGTSMGRSVMEDCAVKEYLEGIVVWKNAVSKILRRDEWLNEITGEMQDEEGNPSVKKKRKRKRRGTKASSEDGGVDENGDSQNKKSASSAVSSIMEVMSVPAGMEQ